MKRPTEPEFEAELTRQVAANANALAARERVSVGQLSDAVAKLRRYEQPAEARS